MADEPDQTSEFDPRAVIELMQREQADTKPIDIEEVKKTATAALAEPVPRTAPAVVRREHPTLTFRAVHRPREPYVQLAVVGGDDIYALPVRQLSASGLAVAAATEQAPLLQPGINVLVDVSLDELELRLHARVEHRREPSSRREGGIRLAWTGVEPPVAERIRRLVAVWNERGDR